MRQKSRFQIPHTVNIILSALETCEESLSLPLIDKRAHTLVGFARTWLNMTKAYRWGEVALILQQRTRTKKNCERYKGHSDTFYPVVFTTRAHHKMTVCKLQE